RRAGGPRPPHAQRAVGRPAAARRHCPVHRHRPVGDPGRRADREPRPHLHRGRAADLRPAQRRRPHRRDDHPRDRRRRPRQADHRAGRRPDRLRRPQRPRPRRAAAPRRPHRRRRRRHRARRAAGRAGGGGVTPDSLRVALRGILSNRMRSALTMLGILIGTASVILLVAVGAGISNQVQSQIGKLGTNAVYILNEKHAGGRDRGGTISREIKLTKDDVRAMSDPHRAPDVARISPVESTSGTVTWNGTTYALGNFAGVETVWKDIRNVHLTEGRWLTDGDQATRAKVGVIGTTVIDHVFGKGVDPLGQTVSFNNVFIKIVGGPEHRGSNGTYDQDDIIYAPITTVFDDIVGDSTDTYSAIGVQAASRTAINPAVAEVNGILRQTHDIKPGDAPDFKI